MKTGSYAVVCTIEDEFSVQPIRYPTDEIAKFIREIRRDIDDISNIASDAERTLGRLLERM